MSSAKIKSYITLKKFMAALGLSLLVAVKLTGVLSAQSITRGYDSDQTMQPGMIVGVKTKDANKVESLDVTQLGRTLGVVVNPNEASISVSGTNQKVFVATTGRYQVLVSDQAGVIGVNDYITLSALSGVGMKASSTQSTILGKSATHFDGTKDVISTSVLTDKSGKQKLVHLGRVYVDIAVGKNPLSKSNGAPALLNKAGEAIAGKPVSALRLYLSALIFIVGTVIAGVILYAGITSSIISIGRNPLSKKSIIRSVLGVSLTSVVIFLICLIGVYLLLKL